MMSIIDELDELELLEKEASAASRAANRAARAALSSAEKSTPAAATRAVDRSTMSVSAAQAKPQEGGSEDVFAKLKNGLRSARQNLTGNTLEGRRARAEAFHASQQDTLRGRYVEPSATKPAESTAPKAETASNIDRSNMEVTRAKDNTPVVPKEEPKAPEAEKTPWYKNKTLMKGVGIGAVGSAGAVAAHSALNNRQQSESRPQGYY